MHNRSKASRRKIIILEGPPGSGKDTQMKDMKGVAVVPIGERLRERCKSSELPLDIRTLLDEGRLLPNSEVIPILEKGLVEFEKEEKIFLNGFPRTFEQAILLNHLLDDRYHGDFTLVCIRLNVSLETCRRRAAKRRESALENGEEARKDDDPHVVENRLQEYRKHSVPMLDYLRKNSCFYEINGEVAEEQVLQQIQKCLMIKPGVLEIA